MALSFLLNIWWLLVLIGVMILVHELGHFWAARAFDVKVEVFSFGFGPRLFGFRRGETDYRFSLFLFGGYVKMAGEQPGENFGAAREDRMRASCAADDRNDPRACQQAALAAADHSRGGPFHERGARGRGSDRPVHGSRTRRSERGRRGHRSRCAGFAGRKSGIQAGDKIVRLDGKDNPDWEDIVTKEIESARAAADGHDRARGHRFPSADAGAG